MFEALVTVCLSLADGPCRDQLVPGYEASTEALCQQALVETPPALDAGVEVDGAPFCQHIGEVLEFQEVADGVFAHMGRIEVPNRSNRGDISNIGFVIGSESVAIIDTGTAPWMGEAIWRAVRAQTDKPVSHVILTHLHPDHVLGTTPLVRAGAKVVGHAGLARALADRQENYLESLSDLIGEEEFVGVARFPVDLAVETELQIDLGGRLLDLRAWPTAHTGTDMTMVDRGSGIMFTGDLVFHLHTPALDGRLLGWKAVMADMSQMEITQIVPGHGGLLLDWPAGGADQQRYLNVLERDARAAVESGMRLGEAVEVVGESEEDLWELFEEYNPRNATVAFTELEWE